MDCSSFYCKRGETRDRVQIRSDAEQGTFRKFY